MEKEAIVERIIKNNKQGEELVKFIQNELPALKVAAVQKQYQDKEVELRKQLIDLKKELEFWQNKIIELEIMNGIPQYSLPSSTVKSSVVDDVSIVKEMASEKETSQQEKTVKLEKQNVNKKPEKKEGKEKSPKENKPIVDEAPINVSRLDLRIGRILNAKRHPDAESLYVEEIDVGENKPRTVVSGLVKYVPLEEMQNRLVVVLCNLKPAKMRGITSEAMVMCASTPEKVEILTPPSGSEPGDRVVCNDYLGDPDPILNPKKKIFEQIAPDLKTNDVCFATYKGSILIVKEKGEVKASSLTNVQIK